MGFADLHIHSVHSDGSATVAAILQHIATHTDLNVIAITDHDTLAGAEEALALAPQFGVQVIPGMEITTRDGHLLALFLEKPVRAGMSFVETAEQVRLFGGLPIAAHPTAVLSAGVGADRLRAIVQRYPGLLAGLEAENGAITPQRQNGSAEELRWELKLAGLSNSDAHTLPDIGCGRTLFAGASVADLRLAIETGAVVPLPIHRRNRFLRRLAARLALRVGAGIVDGLDLRDPNHPVLRWQRLRG